jgi:hypothetical protein
MSICIRRRLDAFSFCRFSVRLAAEGDFDSVQLFQRSSFLPACRVIDSLGEISLSRCMPCDVDSYHQEKSIANGKPIAAATTIQRITHSACERTEDLRSYLHEQPRARYANAAARITLRHFSSAKKP